MRAMLVAEEGRSHEANRATRGASQKLLPPWPVCMNVNLQLGTSGVVRHLLSMLEGRPNAVGGPLSHSWSGI